MSINVSMMRLFSIEVSGQVYDSLLASNRKALTLMQALILEEGKPVSSPRLCRELWENSENPESALKTTVSRLRRLLNAISPRLAACVVSSRGTYRWVSDTDVRVDALEIMELLRALKRATGEDETISLTDRLLKLYTGDLVLIGGSIKGVQLSGWLHGEYLSAVYRLIDILKRREAYNRLVEVCKTAQRVDGLDEQLHIELMQALAQLNRTEQAREEYRTLQRRVKRLLGEEDARLNALVIAGETARFNLDAIRNDLMEVEGATRGPFFCEYAVFKEVYNIYMRNLERLGSTMFLGVVIAEQNARDEAEATRCMDRLRGILATNMRKGDIITRYADNVYAMLLPTVSYITGNAVMERLERLYYADGGETPIHTRIAPLTTMGNG